MTKLRFLTSCRGLRPPAIWSPYCTNQKITLCLGGSVAVVVSLESGVGMVGCMVMR